MRSETEVTISLFFIRIATVSNRILRYLFIGLNIFLVTLNAWTIGRQLSILVKDRYWTGGTLSEMFNLSFYQLAQYLPADVITYGEFLFYEVHIILISVLVFMLVWGAIILLNSNYTYLTRRCRNLETELSDIRIAFRLGHQ